MNTKAVFSFLLILLLNFSCNSIEPDGSGNGVDTTSHNFAWQTWTFGEHSSSILNDVAIVNDSSIWAVGEIYMNDSLGQPDPNAYNAVHWDGAEWKLFRIMFYTICGQQNRTPYPASSILVFSDSDIWVSMNGSQVARLNGTTQIATYCLPISFSINKLWGSESNSIYAVGDFGNIVHYQNGSWTNIESGTDLDIYDIWGDYNSTNGAYEIIAVAAKEFVTYDKKIFRITGNSVQNISTDSIPYSIHGVWFKSGKKYFVAGDGLYSKDNINATIEWDWLHPDITNYYLYAVRGQSINDLFACGAFGEIIHFNGSTWKSYIQETSIYGTLNNIDCKKNLVVAVGYANPKAIITMGTR